MHNGADPVRDDQDGSIAAELLEGVLDHPFRDEIERVCRLIQNQDLRISDKRASEGQSLALTAREPKAMIPNNRFEAFGQRLDKLQGMCFAGRLDEFLVGGAELAVGDVLGDGRVEKIDLLTYYRDLVAPPCEIKLRQSDSIDKQTPRRRIVKAAD